jgi:hypothetical protein
MYEKHKTHWFKVLLFCYWSSFTQQRIETIPVTSHQTLHREGCIQNNRMNFGVPIIGGVLSILHYNGLWGHQSQSAEML